MEVVVKCLLFLIALFSVFPLSVLSQAEDQKGFISIDCGILDGYNSSYGFNYVSDSGFIETGVNHNISSEINATYLPDEYLTLRSFPSGAKSCYTLKPGQGKNNKYLIRAGFMYGNYDNKSDVPRFDLYVGVNWWNTVTLDNAKTYSYYDIIYIADSDTIDVCLVNTGFGTPFISVLELRLLDNNTYVSAYRALDLWFRVDYGSGSSSVRFPDDVYDRIWSPFYDKRYKLLSTNSTIESVTDEKIKLPSAIMETAEMPTNGSNSIGLNFYRDDSNTEFYIYLYFAEIKELQANESREFNIYGNDKFWRGPIVPKYLQTTAVYSNSTTRERQFYVTINKTENSTLPPLLNAFEAYYVKEFLKSRTYQDDVDAIMDIKSAYNLTKYWQGDPCGPETAIWEGLNCSYNNEDPPRIISLKLSSSGLRGPISPSISKLTMLRNLDLSNNSLSGPIPDFLTRLKFLTVLDLSQNELAGPVPQGLIDKSRKGLLSLSVHQNKKYCSSFTCKHKVVVPLVTTIAVVLVIFAALTTLWSLNRRNQVANAGGVGFNSDDGALRSKEKQLISYSEVLNITKNMESVIGHGNFGTVYHGRLDGIPVAVKILHPSYANAYKQFRANARLITRVHHRRLTACFGYFDDANHKGLIYEFMPNGSLEDILTGQNSILLSWLERLQIVMDVAQGLDYLHNSCKPPIIHGNLKPTNILFNEQNQSKLVDFGLSAIFSTEAGSTQYLDPEYHVTNKFTERSDVYSFGVVFLSIITNQPATTSTGGETNLTLRVKSLVEKGDIRNVVDSRLKGDDFYVDSVWKAVEIAMACASPFSARRPSINQVVMELNQCLAMELSRISRTTGTIEMVTVNLSPGVIPQPR